MAVDKKPVANMSDVINSLRPIESGDLLFIVQVNGDELIANFWQQLAIVDWAELIHIDVVFVRIYSGLHVLLLESYPGFSAIGLSLFEPPELVEAVSVKKDESDHSLIKLLIDHGR